MTIKRRLVKWLPVTGSVVVLLFLLQVSVLAFPDPWFAYQHQVGTLTFHSDATFGSDLLKVATDVDRRARAMGLYDPTARLDIYICHSQMLFRLFGRLSLVPGTVPGFNLSIFNNSFVSVTLLEKRRIQNIGFPPCSALGEHQLRMFDQRTRDCYRWGLIVEYLAEIKGYGFADIMHGSVTEKSAMGDLETWLADPVSGTGIQ